MAQASFKPIRSLLVANRGEIALRIMRTARRQGMRSVAVYSEADRDAPHVAFADDAVLIGGGPATQSYLKGDAIIAAAQQSGADAVHPGYGFLSENAEFARAVVDAGLVFVGPTADAIDAMGDKARAKRRMIEAKVPCVPGYEGEDQSFARFKEAADEIGYPVMVKAAAGGGGRGMRLVDDAADLEGAIRLAKSEALSAFGSDGLILEKAVQRPRHIEIQVFADQSGHTVHMGERDCSVQRRHQKVIEESPSPVVSADLRAAMGAAAVNAAKAIGYVGAGTVEFLLDDSGAFYFLEMNTRLQVEHPVTEMVTGLDLVQLQLAVAQGLPLGLEQDDISLDGHAIEARLYAEDASEDFRPATGTIALWQPAAGAGVRVDDGIVTGQDVSPFYDPMLAKVIAWGETRDVARRRLIAALERSALLGVTSNKRFLTQILERDTFAAGAATTAFIAEEFEAGDLTVPEPDAETLAIAAVLFFHAGRAAAWQASAGVAQELLNWTSSGAIPAVIEIETEGAVHTLFVSPDGANSYGVRVGERVVPVTFDGGTISVRGRKSSAVWVLDGNRLGLEAQGFSRIFTRASRLATQDGQGAEGDVRAPMHGVVTDVFVAEGQQVAKGDRLAVLEAMKMQHEICADIAGTVSAVLCAAGAQASADDLMIEITPDGECNDG